MTVYRFQDKDGRGPFKPGFSRLWLDEEPKLHEEILVPWPLQFPDALIKIQCFKLLHCGCGCATVEQLMLWFTAAEEKRLRGFGYSAVVLDVDEVIGQSDVQVVFRRNKPLKEDVRKFDLHGLFGEDRLTNLSGLGRVRGL